jgi:hypothetical protein
MARKSKPIDGGYQEHHAALLPIRFDSVPMGTGLLGSDVVPKAARPILMQYSDNEAEQRCFLEALLELPWLATEIRRAVMKALGRSQQDHNTRVELARTVTLALMVDEAAARMREHGQQPAEGIRTAALAEVAEVAGFNPETLAKRIQRAGHD